MQWRSTWFIRHQVATAALILFVTSALFGAYTVYSSPHNPQLVCPGCNPPEMLFFDHYTIQNNTSLKPSLLTIWFMSSGPAGKSLTVKDLTIFDGSTEYSFTVQNVRIPALSVVPVTVDTSTARFYFSAGTYNVGVLTDQSYFGGINIAYPPQSLVQTLYTIGYDNNQANATVLILTLANRGPTPATLATLTINDQAANSTTETFPMNGPTVNPGATTQVTVDTLGSGFYFKHQHFYTLTITPAVGVSSTSSILFQ